MRAHASKPRVAKCLHCGLCQVPLSEQPADLEQRNVDVVDETYLANLPAIAKTAAHAYRRIAPFLPESGRLLEVGSYCGLFLREARDHGWTVQGIEPSRGAAEYARSTTGLDVIHGNFEAVAPSLQSGRDAVVSWDLIEHVRDPKQFLRSANGLLRPGGVMAVSTIDINPGFRGCWGATGRRSWRGACIILVPIRWKGCLAKPASSSFASALSPLRVVTSSVSKTMRHDAGAARACVLEGGCAISQTAPSVDTRGHQALSRKEKRRGRAASAGMLIRFSDQGCRTSA